MADRGRRQSKIIPKFLKHLPNRIRRSLSGSPPDISPDQVEHQPASSSSGDLLSPGRIPSPSQSNPYVALVSPNDQAESGGRVHEWICIGWKGVKEALKLVETFSDDVPILNASVKAVNAVIDRVDKIKGAQRDFEEIANKTKIFLDILKRCGTDSNLKSALSRRVNELVEALSALEATMNVIVDRPRYRRVIEAAGDADEVIRCLRKFTSLIDGFIMETTISTERRVEDIQQGMSGVGAGVANLQDDAKLRKLNHVATASIDSQDHAGCLEGTRVGVLAELHNWANDRNSPPVFWLDGMAGTGKTSIAVTFCRKLQRQGMLSGSFFCTRQDVEDRRNVRRIIPTLAYGLAYSRPQYREALLRSISRIPDPGTLSLRQQWRKLLVEPFNSLPSSPESPPILSVDALDECGNSGATEEMLEAARDYATSLPLKFFFTSRPEAHIRYHFTHPDFADRSIFRLHEVQEDVVCGDILLYLRSKLEAVRKGRRLSPEWPPESQVRTLATRAGQFFIYAFTACEYIRNLRMDPRRCLERLTIADIANSSPAPVVQPIDDLYSLVLSDAFSSLYLEKSDRENLRRMLAVIVGTHQPLSSTDIDGLLEMDPGTTWTALQSLRSVVRIPEENENGCLSVFHASFPDYLTSQERCQNAVWFISADEMHHMLAHQCICVLDAKLDFNISGCRNSYLENNRQGHTKAIDHYLIYASMYWVDHLLGSSDQAALVHDVESLLYSKFLFWLEVLSVQSCLHHAASALPKLIEVCSKIDTSSSRPLQVFAWDANTFVTRFWDAISRSAPHIYLSALAFSHKESKVSTHAASRFSRSTVGNLIPSQIQSLATSCGHSDAVNSVQFSPDGQQLVSGSDDCTLRLWDVRTGEVIGQPFEGHTDWVTSVAFSPDGHQLVSGSEDHTVRLWDAATGEAIGQSFEGHTDWVTSVAFSPDGQQLISGSREYTLQLWNTTTGEAIGQPFEGHTDWVTSVAFSPDGQQLVSGSYDNTLRLWDARTSEPVGHPFEGHTQPVTSVAFSPDGCQLVSGSYDCTLRLWNAMTGQAIGQAFEGHTQPIASVTFSHDGQQLVSGSHDSTLRLWDVMTGEAIGQPFEGHTKRISSVAISPDGKQLVSGSHDHTLRLWDATTSEVIGQSFERHIKQVTSVAFSPDGEAIVQHLEENLNSGHSAAISSYDQQLVSPVEEHTQRLTSASFSPDGQQPASPSCDSTLDLQL